MKQTFKEIFQEKGISPSYTRIRIYSYLEENLIHPTVDEIYKTLKKELPTLSKTTVYNVLKLFMETDIVKSVNMQSSETRYELHLEDHSHFRCTSCGEIFDIPLIKPLYDLTNFGDFEVQKEEVNLSGICPKCRQKKIAQ